MIAAPPPAPAPRAGAVGVIGLGAMGAGVAEVLLRAGYELHALEGRAAAQIRRLGEIGPVVAHPRLADLLDRVDHVLTCLPAGPDVVAVARQLPVDPSRSRALIDCSTIGVSAAAEVWELARTAGWQYVDAPLTGGPARAATGELLCYLSSDGEPRPGVMDIADAFSVRVVRLGEPGSGQTIKLANNSIVLGLVALNGYALSLAESAGVGVDEFVEIVRGGAADNWQLQNYLPAALAPGARPGFALQLAHKDLGLVIDAARGRDLDLGVLEAVDAVYRRASAREREEGRRLDFSAVIGELAPGAPSVSGDRSSD